MDCRKGRNLAVYQELSMQHWDLSFPSQNQGEDGLHVCDRFEKPCLVQIYLLRFSFLLDIFVYSVEYQGHENHVMLVDSNYPHNCRHITQVARLLLVFALFCIYILQGFDFTPRIPT